jgi:hypothetical protein
MFVVGGTLAGQEYLSLHLYVIKIIEYENIIIAFFVNPYE